MGRKPIGKEKRKRYNIMLEPNTHKYLKLLGDGNLSAGIHLAALRSMADTLVDAVEKLPKKRKARQP
jgi:hypothetical protein